MTNQEAFNKAVKHLFEQGHRAGVARDSEYRYDPFSCHYDGPSGRCAVGGILSEETIAAIHAYDKAQEAGPEDAWALNFLDVDTLKYDLPEAAAELAGVSDELLAELQGVHDNRASWTEDGLSERGKSELREIAVTFDLDLPPELARA